MTKPTSVKPNKQSYAKDLILLFAVPIAIAVFAAGIVHIPRLLAKPKYDFIYTACLDFYCDGGYGIDSSGQVVEDTENNQYYSSSYGRKMTIHLYSVANDSSKTLTLEEARKYKLSSSTKSVDGYTVVKQRSGSGFLFWGTYDEGWYIKNGPKSKKIELPTASNNYTNITFLGWVK